MADPTWAECATQLVNNIKPYTDLYADYPTIVTSIDTAEQSVEGDYQPRTVGATLATLRNRLSVCLTRAEVRRVWNGWLLETCRLLAFPERDTLGMAIRIHRYMAANAVDFNDRNQTIPTSGTPGGGNVGDGTVEVLKVDHEAFPLQTPTTETKTLECVQDQNLGRLKNAEVFEMRGIAASKDNLDEKGSGIRQRVFSMHAGAGAGGSVLQNSSFDSAFSGSGTDKIPGWTIAGTAAKITLDTSNTYRSVPGASSDGALAFADDAAATNQVTQALSVRRINALSERTPWMMQCAYKHSAGSITGTLNLKMGNKTESIDLSGATTSYQVALFARDKDLYYRNWREDAPDIEIEVVNLSAGTLYIDDVIFAPMTLIDGLWWWLAGGGTAFLERDVFTHAVTGGAMADAEMMGSWRWARMPWFGMPTVNDGSETISDP